MEQKVSRIAGCLIFYLMTLAQELIAPQQEAQSSPKDLMAFYMEIDARLNRIQAQIEELAAAQATLTKRFQTIDGRLKLIESQLQSLILLTNQPFVTQQQLQTVISNLVREVNDNRVEDLEFVRQQLKRLQEVLSQSNSGKSESTSAPRKYSRGYEYIVQPGDTLNSIIAAYRKEGVKVTLPMLLEANPGLNPNLIYPGQKIFIPDPKLER